MAGAQPLPEAYPNPKSSMDMDNDPEAATALKGSGAEGKGQQAQRGSVPYTLYRNLRLDSIRSALGLGEHADSACPAGSGCTIGFTSSIPPMQPRSSGPPAIMHLS